MYVERQGELQREGTGVSPDAVMPYRSSRQYPWAAIAVDHYRLRRGDAVSVSGSENVVWLQLRGRTTCAWHHDSRVLQKTSHPADIAITPMRHCANWRHEDAKEGEIVALALPATFADTVAASMNIGSGERIELVAHFSLRDALIEQIASGLVAELANAGCASSVYVASAAALLGVHLFRNYSNAANHAGPASTALSQHKLQRATDYINANLRGNLTLEAIARHVSMGRFHFAHLFKQSTGESPYQYVTRVRIEHAKNLLADTQLSVVAIANQVGFASPSHFSMVFRRFAGSTPSDYRERQA